MSGVERVLDAIDAGLQRSSEGGMPNDSGKCARCQIHPPMDDGSLCAGCRTYLLGDTDVDPRSQQIDMEALAALGDFLTRILDAFAEAMRDLAAAFTSPAMRDVLDQLAALADKPVQIDHPMCPRGHGPTKGGLCRRCVRPNITKARHP